MELARAFGRQNDFWFRQRTFDALHDNGGLTQISQLVSEPGVPLKLLADILEPYASAPDQRDDQKALKEFLQSNRKVPARFSRADRVCSESWARPRSRTCGHWT